jgi:hypothetical protein
MAPNFAAMGRDYFNQLTQQAQLLAAAEAAGSSTESFDFSSTVRTAIRPSAFGFV